MLTFAITQVENNLNNLQCETIDVAIINCDIFP